MRLQTLDNSQQRNGAAALGVRCGARVLRRQGLAAMLSLVLLVSGCARFESFWNRPLFWGTNPPPVYEDPTPYRNWASEIDYPEMVTMPTAPELNVVEPRRLRNLQKEDIWDMPLEQAIQIALSNSEIIRSAGQFLSPANPLLNSPDFVPSSLDPAIQESGVLFGQRGIEAALSEFDAQFTTTAIWGRDEQIQNSQIGTGVTPGSTLTQETGAVSVGVTKRFATGGIVAFLHDWNYQGTNTNDFIPGARLFPSSYTGRVRVEARQPLWAGAGAEYTRIAGPITEQIQGVTGVQQGVVIARINNDIELTEFAGAIRDLLRDVETLYWQLYLAYQSFDMEKSLLTDAERSYRKVEALAASGSAYAGSLEKYQAESFLLQMQDRVDLARNSLYDAEAQLRRIIGLTVNDGKVIRPIDEPTLAEFVPDWQITLSEALARRVELRRHKWNIKRLEFQLRAAEHLLKPRLDFVASYQLNGFGDDLLGGINTNNGIVQTNLGNAVDTLIRGDQTGWNMGFEFSFPFGMRFAHTQVKNLQFQLAKARATLREAENEISHELAASFRELDQSYLSMERSFNQKRNAAKQLQAVEALHQNEPDRFPQERVLQARDSLAQMERTFMQSLIEYNVAVMELHYRAGKLLELNNVHLSEGPWDAEAEFDVQDRSYDRWHSLPTKTMLHAAPEPFVYHGELVPEGPPTEAYGPATEGWINDAPATLEPSETPLRDLDLPNEDVPVYPSPAPAEPMAPREFPSAPPRQPSIHSPIERPELPTRDAGPFLLPVPNGQPTAGGQQVSGIQQASGIQKSAASPPAGAVWDLGSTRQVQQTRSSTAKQTSPNPRRRPNRSDELRAQILRRSAQARGLPTRTQHLQGKR